MVIVIKNPKLCPACGAMLAFGNCTNLGCTTNAPTTSSSDDDDDER